MGEREGGIETTTETSIQVFSFSVTYEVTAGDGGLAEECFYRGEDSADGAVGFGYFL